MSHVATPDRDAAPGGVDDGVRTARLLFDPELSSGALHPSALDVPAVRDAVRVHPIPAAPVRFVQDAWSQFGRLDWESAVARPLAAARRAVLGADASAPPRFLVRVDEFPHYLASDEPERFGTERFTRFHELMTAAGVPYLVAALPRVSRAPLTPARGGESRPLDDGEAAMLQRLVADGVALALHGRDHRTRFTSPRHHSELGGLDAAATAALLDDARAELARHGLRPDVFVPPYNRFDAPQWTPLAQRFAVVCGGPESIGRIGFHRSPQWRGEAVYLPSYPPLYGHAHEILPAARRAIARADGLWEPIVLHWGWESRAGFADLERLLETIAPCAVRWDEFAAAVQRSRGETAG